MVGVFAATDVFLFYVFFEAMLVPMYFLIGSFGGPRRQYAAVKFFLYSLVGGLVMLAAVIGLYVVSSQPAGRRARSPSTRCASSTSTPGVQKLLFLGFFIAFAIKAPLVPFHTWLPDAGAEAPIGGACCWSACWTRSARSASCATACRCSPTRRATSRPWILGAGGRRHPLRRAAGHGAERHEAAGVLHLDLALRLHRAGHLRLHHRGRHRRGALHGQPRHRRPACCSSSSAC